MFKLLFVILALFLIMLAISKCKFTESFANTPVAITSDNVADYIYTVYKADVKAIQNLADIAMKLQAGGITVPGTMTIKNTLNVEGIAEITGATNLASKLNVTGATNLASTLNVTGATDLASTLNVTGATNLASTLNVIGDITGKTIKELQDKVAALEANIQTCVKIGDRIRIGDGHNNFYIGSDWKIKIHGGGEEGPYGDQWVISRV